MQLRLTHEGGYSVWVGDFPTLDACRQRILELDQDWERGNTLNPVFECYEGSDAEATDLDTGAVYYLDGDEGWILFSQPRTGGLDAFDFAILAIMLVLFVLFLVIAVA